ncbi:MULTISPECIES: FAD-dependent 5-carboxymethylaminomethyl-2-thiouridine(34) oxidoreductase MnmC [Acidovorax]|uniref:tRNA 5-methylaminomethyl-2-thiouridine biosynthesis bifunctional protein MnmC n=1 Tax=Acidovorax facilis TaxID=12917 RepID=A0ABV8DG91_9BURK|nr:MULTISPECIES: FAD-dependent 5-carboxymethylaminomethyl-2-thiouridine(34) oxidoreductase MnmC [Acidovorax]KQB60863.1 FAD-dependent cmnm(5)s(2)U34 oxidoreductase [Acidovorax sp. SD340]MBO1006636.1 FAD-dependent 5-carboxymethylaminomethyl-2-thiouridine(34) oxidoreductase MnmC [Acidovorax sp. SD340]MCO4242697.1 FAD-dependent 5-carboxymethylaminomethyl-2-thiouridine(34) oxidoreductase MnmC [Acidovorax facilis]
MTEPIEWLPDGTPYSPRFGDRYHSENGGLTQARRVFLHGCGLPEAWAGQPQWRILETGFGFGLNFLVTWAAWRADLQRPTLLHFVSTEAWPVSAGDLLRATSVHPELAPLAEALHRQWWGLLPGVHRLRFDEGRVLLTLYVGDTQTMLRQQNLTVDSIYLDGFSPQRNPESWDLHTLKAVARCCHRGTQLATWTIARAVRDGLAQCGFEVNRVPGVPPKRDNLHATYNPHWEPRTARQPVATPQPALPGPCIVIGGGIAGAAAAASLARRGWQVVVLDQAPEPAAGASALPAGVFAPHVSPDDSVLSRLSRSGIRTTLEQARWLLSEGMDWAHCGVLEHRTDGTPGLSPAWDQGPGAAWSEPAPSAALAAAQLPPDATACWHHQAGWVRPARLATALLAQPGIRWQGGCQVAQLRRAEPPAADDHPATTVWQALDAQGQVLAEAPTVVIAAGAGSLELLNHRWPLQPVRGQVSWGDHADPAAPLLPFPANGNGNLVPRFPLGGDAGGRQGWVWVMGSTFERDVQALPPSAADVQAAHATNWGKLQALLPAIAPQLAPAFHQASLAPPTAASEPEGGPAAPPALKTWAAVRCTAPDRLPIVGPVDATDLPGLWVNTAMGARGLTLALLCGELLAARLQGEPLPLDAKLARALGTERL